MRAGVGSTRVRNVHRLALALGLLGAVCGPAAAHVVSNSVTAVVTEIIDPASLLGGALGPGDTVRGAFVFDLDVMDRTAGAGRGDWPAFEPGDPGVTLLELFAFVAESLSARATGIPERHAVDGADGVDQFAFDTCQVEAKVGSRPLGLSLCLVFLLSDLTGHALIGDAPKLPLELADWTDGSFVLFQPPGSDQGIPGPAFGVSARVTGLVSTVVSIPEPPPVGLFATAGAYLAWTEWRRRSRRRAVVA